MVRCNNNIMKKGIKRVDVRSHKEEYAATVSPIPSSQEVVKVLLSHTNKATRIVTMDGTTNKRKANCETAMLGS